MAEQLLGALELVPGAAANREVDVEALGRHGCHFREAGNLRRRKLYGAFRRDRLNLPRGKLGRRGGQGRDQPQRLGAREALGQQRLDPGLGPMGGGR